MDVPSNLISDNSPFSTAKACGNKNSFYIGCALNDSFCTCHHEPQVSACNLKAEIPAYCIHVCDVNLRVNELCIHFGCSRFKLRLNSGILRTTGYKSNLDRFQFFRTHFPISFSEGPLSVIFSSSSGFSLGNDFRNSAILLTKSCASSPNSGYFTSKTGIPFERIKYFISSLVRLQPTQPKFVGGFSTIIEASASSIRGPIRAILPLTPGGTSIAAYRSPNLGSSGVIFRGGESKLIFVTFSLIWFMMTRGLCPKRSTRSAKIRLFTG